jgi:CHAT domain-containing protein
MISFFFASDALYAFLLTQSRFHVDRLSCDPRALSARVENFLELVSRGENANAVAARLDRDLVQPIRRLLPPGIRRLILVPEGVLHNLPFEVLRSDGGHLLIQDFVISYAPSATTLAALRAARSEPERDRRDLIAFANPAALPGARSAAAGPSETMRSLYEAEGFVLGPLPYSEEEARAIRRYAARGSEVYTGGEASEQRVKQTRLDRFRILHFATHGWISERYPARSALILAATGSQNEDGFLQAREIARLGLGGDLVVLSGCQTARGRVLAGEGVESLARAFFFAGARSVVASLWSVSDRKTADLMASFYRHLAGGASKAEALRSAKLELVSRRDSPRYWAPFILIGESDAAVPISQESSRLGLPAALLLVGLIAIFALLIRATGIRKKHPR